MLNIRADEFPQLDLIRAQGWNIARRPCQPDYLKTYWSDAGGAVRKSIGLPPSADRGRLGVALAHELMHAIGFDRGTIRTTPSRGSAALERQDMMEERIAETGAYVMCEWWGWTYVDGVGTHRYGEFTGEEIPELRARLSVVASLARGLGWPPEPADALSEDRLRAQACARAGNAPPRPRGCLDGDPSTAAGSLG